MNTVALKQSGLRWLWLVLVVFGLDVITKQWVINSMQYGWENRIEVLPFFNLLYVHNHGAAFSFLSDAGGWQRWFFTVIALGVSLLLAYWMSQTSVKQRLLNIAYALVMGGALGNLLDRVMHGYVVDFLDFYLGDHHWPAFNVADIAICVGAGLIVLESFMGKSEPKLES